MPIGGTVTPKTDNIFIRLPDNKLDIKKKLHSMAKRNKMTMTELCIIALERFLADVKDGRPIEITIK